MIVDPEKQFVDEESELAPLEFSEEEVIEPLVESKDLTQYGLVAKVAKNGIVLLWEWLPLEQARLEAKDLFEQM